MSLWRVRSPDARTEVLCLCSCHAGCPLADQRTATDDAWRGHCTCPGSERVKARLAHSEEQRRQVADVVAEVRREIHDERLQDADEIERRLRARYVDRGLVLPPGLPTVARVAAASEAPRGTRTPRLLWMGARAVARTVRWAWQPDAEPGTTDRRSIREMYRGTGVTATLGATLAVLAVRSSGRRRLLAGLGAALALLSTGWTIAIGTALGQFVRAIDQRRSTR
jgi:hypothetical protein